MSTRRERATRPTALLALLAAGAASAQPLGTTFTYRGHLTESGQPANGIYDLRACLHVSPTDVVPLACAADFDDLPVQDGLLTLALDFGTAPFDGPQRFLELRVRPATSSGAFDTLAPRPRLRAAPEALRAARASLAPWAGLTGVPTGFTDGIDDSSGGTVIAVDSGAGLAGGPIASSGTLVIATGGIGSTQIAAGAVGAAQLAAGAIGVGQIDAGQVQVRASGMCGIGDSVRAILASGNFICEPVPGVPRIAILDDPATSVGLHVAIAIGTDGRPVLSYFDETTADLKVARCANAACTGIATVTTIDGQSSSVGSWTSIAVGSDGRPVISYQDIAAGALKVAKCANAGCTGSPAITTVDDPANLVGDFTSIAIGGDGRPVISYRDITASALKVAKCANADCSGVATITTVDDPPNIVGTYGAIAIGTDGNPVISYLDANFSSLKVASCGNPACTGTSLINIIDDPTNTLAAGTDIAIAGSGLPVISYHDASAGTLKVARCRDSRCATGATISVVDDPANSVGALPSIAIGSDGLPVLAYHDETAGSLKVARCNTEDCAGVATITTVDDPANRVGLFASIAIGRDGLPIVGYWDETAARLKVTKCGTRSCR